MDDLADRVRLRCARLIPWGYEDQVALPYHQAAALLDSGLAIDLLRIGDRRADQLIAAALRLGHEHYLDTYEGDPDSEVEGEAHAVAGASRRWLADTAKDEIAAALGSRSTARRREVAYMVAVRIAALRER